MVENMTSPRRASELRAWAEAVTGRVNALGAVGGAGVLVRDGAGGTGFAPLPENRRQRVSGGLSPFAVRYVEEDSDAGIPYTGLEIYIPTGSVALASTLTPINPAAYREVDGEETTLPGWYFVRMATTPTANAAYDVTLYCKALAGIYGADEFDDYPKGYVWAEALRTSDTPSDGARAGTQLEVTVGRVTFKSDGTGGLTATYAHGRTGAIAAVYERAKEFELWWAFEQPEITGDDTELTVEKVYLRNPTFAAAGISFHADGLTELTIGDETSVYLVIETTATSPTAQIRCYSALPGADGSTTIAPATQAAAAKTATQIMVLLYTLLKGRVSTDNRRSAMNIQVYQ